MAIRTITTTVDPLNGQTINTINGLVVGDTIIGTVLRKNMCVGAFFYQQATFSLTVPNGSVTSFTIPNTGAAGLPPIDTTLLIGSITMVADGNAWVEGNQFTATGTGNRVLTFSPAYTGTSKVTTITFDYYDTTVANLSFDTKVFPDNCRATVNLGGYDMIVWNNGIHSQDIKAGVTAGTANAVVEAIITDQ